MGVLSRSRPRRRCTGVAGQQRRWRTRPGRTISLSARRWQDVFDNVLRRLLRASRITPAQVPTSFEPSTLRRDYRRLSPLGRRACLPAVVGGHSHARPAEARNHLPRCGARRRTAAAARRRCWCSRRGPGIMRPQAPTSAQAAPCWTATAAATVPARSRRRTRARSGW